MLQARKSIKEELNEKGLRFTRQRAAVLKVLKSSKIPLTIEAIVQDLDMEMDLSTVYRILDVFEEKELLEKTNLLTPGSVYYDYNRNIHKHHLICTQCEKFIVIKGCPLHDYEKEIALDSGFSISHHQLEIYGICPDCQTKESIL